MFQIVTLRTLSTPPLNIFTHWNSFHVFAAKLRALLSQSLQAAMSATPTAAFNRSLEDMRRTFPLVDTAHVSSSPTHSLKAKSSRKEQSQAMPYISTPPPAHQHSSKVAATAAPSDGMLDLTRKLLSEPSSIALGESFRILLLSTSKFDFWVFVALR